MKKSLSIIFILSITLASFAQKGSVSKAKNYRTKGDLINAKAEIDVAITIEKIAKKPTTWFERGEIYRTIVTNEDEAIRNLDTDALNKALEAYNKVLSMEKENSVNAVFSTQNIETLWTFYLNKGGDQYAADNFEDAYNSFVNSLVVKPEDSLSLLYAGVAAQQAKMYDKAVLHYSKMTDLNLASADIYSSIVYIERAINKDEEKALEVLQKAKAAYPSKSNFNQEEIAILINLDRLEQAKSKIQAEIEKDPSNANLYLNLAIMYDNIGSAKAEEGKVDEANENYELAKTNYKKTVELDPDSYVGNFNLGAMYVNAAKVYYDQVRDMDLKTYDKKGPAMVEKADQILREGLPFLKKATEIKPDDTGALTALQQMYTQLKMYDEAEAVMKKVDALNGDQ